MPQPTWITPAGNFGTYTEGVPITKTFIATPSNMSYTLEYTVLNGIFPVAVVDFTLNPATGVLTGTPDQVSATTNFPFTIRVFEYNGPSQVGFTDRTFSFDVEGVSPPTFITPTGPLYPGPGYLPDNTWSPYQIEVDNPDPGTSAVIRLVGGSLPPGIEINSSGFIRGYADPSNTNYQFTLQVDSASGTSTGDFSIQVVQQTPLTRAPAILNTQPPSYTIQQSDPNAPYYITGVNRLSNTVEISSIVRTDKFVVVDTTANHEFSNSDTVIVSGVGYTVDPFDGVYSGITVLTPTQFIYYQDAGDESGIVTPGTSIVIYTYRVATLVQDDYFVYRILGNSFGSGSISYTTGGTLPLGMTDNINYSPANVTVTPVNPGTGYAPGDLIYVNGSDLGGSNVTNDLNLTVTSISGTGGIQTAVVTGGLNVDSNTVFGSVDVQGGSGSGAKLNVTKINAGWLQGTLTTLPSMYDVYAFSYTAINNFNGLLSSAIWFNIPVVSQAAGIPLDTSINWITPANLGTIINGSISSLEVDASSPSNLELEYILISGSLPADLTLNSDGTISGIVAFETGITPIPQGSSVDYTFLVRAQNPDYPEINAVKEFTVTVYQEFDQPYQNLYIKSFFDLHDRAVLDSLLQDEYFLPQTWLYRPLDSNFGKAKDVIYQHMYGVPASYTADYITAVEKNHYRRNLVLGPIKTAVAKDSAGDIQYEVVYSEIVDNLVNDRGVSVSKEITWPYPITTVDNKVYPNSLPNMREQVADELGQFTQSALLPLWMSSQQEDGSILGFTPAWVICYTKPGYSEIIKNNIVTPFNGPITIISTSGIDSTLECQSTLDFWPGMRVKFSGDGFGSVAIDTIYYIYSVISEKQFTITTSMLTGPVPLTAGTFGMGSEMFMEHVAWDHTLNELNFRTDRFIVARGLTYDYDPGTGTWAVLPSGVDQTDDRDQFIFWNKNILGNT